MFRDFSDRMEIIMKFFVNPSCLTSAFTLPVSIVDSHLNFAKSEHIKVILYIFRNFAEGIDVNTISNNLSISEYEVKEALLYWADADILISENTVKAPQKMTLKTVTKSEKPDRVDVAKRGAADLKIRYLLNETQMKLGRNLKTNETSTLVWLYEDEGLDVSIILLIVQYAVTHGKANIRFIEQTAIDWINKGIDSMSDAEEELRVLAEEEQAWKTVSSCFGIEKRKPSANEKEKSHLWIFEWKISKEMLVSAYDECVNAKSKFSFAYVAKIIERWHNEGYNPNDVVDKKGTKNDKDDFGAFDLDLYEEMIKLKD